jgi:succinyl-CoA synthetase alpha subunit
MLANRRVSVSEDDNPKSREYFLQITVDRATCTPCIITSYSIGGESPHIHAKAHALGLDMRVNGSTYSSIVAELHCSRDSYESLTRILTAMIDIFFRKEASSLTVRLSRITSGKISVARSEFSFDDSAFRSSKRQEEIQAMRDVEREIPDEVEAGKDGIVYIK